jgi:hypothetical protein
MTTPENKTLTHDTSGKKIQNITFLQTGARNLPLGVLPPFL